MKAVHIHDYGGLDVLHYAEDAARPVPGTGEVLIRVHATTINPFDCAVRAGYMGQYFNYTFPLILGTDVSGVVEEVGPSASVGGFAELLAANPPSVLPFHYPPSHLSFPPDGGFQLTFSLFD